MGPYVVYAIPKERLSMQSPKKGSIVHIQQAFLDQASLRNIHHLVHYSRLLLWICLISNEQLHRTDRTAMTSGSDDLNPRAILFCECLCGRKYGTASPGIFEERRSRSRHPAWALVVYPRGARSLGGITKHVVRTPRKTHPKLHNPSP